MNSTTLQSVCTKIGSGATPRGGKEAYKEEGISIIRSQNVLDFSFTENGLAFIDEAQAKRLKNVIVKQDDVLLNITGDSVARVCSVPDWVLPARVNQHVAIVRANRFELEPNYLKYHLLSPRSKKELLNLASSGATRNALTKSMIENFEINLPKLPEQKAIAHVLGKLDEKIELNRKMNQTLESMAQALFKSWFVDFDPVIDNALAAGNEIPEPLKVKAEKRKGLKANSSQLAALFPSSFEFNETLDKWIPEGWGVKRLDEITTELRRGISPKYIEEGGVLVLNQKCIRNHEINFSLGRRNDPTKKKVDGRHIMPGDVLVNSTGVGTLGRMANIIDVPEPTVVDSHVTVVRPNKEIIDPFYFNGLMLSIERSIEAMGEGSTGQTELSRARLSEYEVLVAPTILQEHIGKQLRDIYNKKNENLKENTILTQLRDTLLPKLISGKVRLAEGLVERFKE